MSRLLRSLGIVRLTTRPSHPKKKPGDAEDFKKIPDILKTIQAEHPDETIELWCQDETRIGQKGRRTRTWAEKGSRPAAPIDTRYGNTYLFGAFCPARDTGVALVLPKANTRMMQPHLNEISSQLPPKTHAAIIVDGAGWHHTPKLIVPDNITLIKLPPYCPEPFA